MPIRTVDPKVLHRWVNEGGATLIDVREPVEYRGENIPGAMLVPLATVSKETMPDHAGKKLVVHCQSGKRAEAVAKKLLEQNPDLEIYNLEGGIAAWKNAGLATNKAGGFFLPLDRQVQLAIGLCVLTGSLLGYYATPAFFMLSGFFGLGLMFAGITGWCGLAMLMARMPWNRMSGPTCKP